MSIRNFATRIFIELLARVATRRPVPEYYSLSSSPSPLNNFCYLALNYPKSDAMEKFLIRSISPKLGYHGFAFPSKSDGGFDESARGIEACLPSSLLGAPRFEIQRIYGSQAIKYSNAWEFLAGELTFRPQRLHRKEVRQQKSFEKNFRFTCERISTLREILDWRREEVEGNQPRQFLRAKFSQFDLYTRLFSIRAWELKNHDKHLAELELVLDSLVYSGDLAREAGEYVIQGKSLQTLSDFENDDRRAKAADRGNTRMFWLTVIIAIATGIQAYFVAYPSGH